MNMKTLMAFALCVTTFPVFAACGGQNRNSAYDPYFDGRFERLGGTGGDVYELRNPLVSDINAAYEFQSYFYYTSAMLDESGAIKPGNSAVLAVSVNDVGTTLTSVDDQFFSMRLQIENDGRITAGFLGTDGGSIGSIFRRFDNDKFRSGQCYILYRDDNVVIGQVDAEFDTYKVDVNFRALTRRR